MTRRVLIVTSSFAPAMIADMHRARQLAWELPKSGWQVEILSPDVGIQPTSCIDEDGGSFFPTGILTHSVSPVWPALFQVMGFGTIGWRALGPLACLGRKVLRSRRFDLVFFSTTQFPLFLLGPIWQRWAGVPFVLDFHDPCYKEGSLQPVWTRPSLKHKVSTWLAKHVERCTVANAAGVVAVSSSYIGTLRNRYAERAPAWLGLGRNAVIPFGVLPRDLEEAGMRTRRSDRRPKERAKIIYVGAGGPVMERSFSLLCKALTRIREQNPVLLDQVRIELHGTMLGWRKGDRCHLMEIARQNGLDNVIDEDPRRASYRRSLELLLESEGALILGVDDPSYMPSKLFSYALSGKPLLLSVHREGPAYAKLGGNPNLGRAVWFAQSEEMPVDQAAEAVRAFLREVVARRSFDRRSELEPFFARSMALQHAALFDACLGFPSRERDRPLGITTPCSE